MPPSVTTDYRVKPRGRKERKLEHEDQMDAATLAWKKDYAVFLKAADHSYRKISKILGVTSRMVKTWFEDPKMQERVNVVRADMVDGAMKVLKLASVEAAQILLDSARGALSQGMWKEAREGAESVLDRNGVSKVNKSESKVTKTDRVEHDTAEGFFDKFEALPHETQVAIANLMGQVESLVADARGSE